MAYQTGSATDLEDLISKLLTFATANGWTQDEFATADGDFALHKDDIYVSGRWDTVTPQHVSLHQALGFDGTGTLPGDHTDDSGHGYNDSSSHVDTNLDNERSVTYIGDGPFTTYHFFEDDDGTRSYLHVVVQSETDVYRHFGFGEVDKVGTWTGGEYCYGHYQDNGTSQQATAADTCMLFDGINSSNPDNIGKRNATIHVEGLNGQGGSDKWGIVFGSRTIDVSGDLDGNGNSLTRCLGGFRGGPVAFAWGGFSGSNLVGFVPMYPINVWHFEEANSRVRLLGSMPHVRGVNMRNFAPEQEVTIGGDTWVFFPSSRRTSDNVANRTYHQGIAYKKVTT